MEHEDLQYKIVVGEGQDTELLARLASLELSIVDLHAKFPHAKSPLLDSVGKPVHAVVKTAPEAALREHDVHAIPDDGVGWDSKVRWGLRFHHPVGRLVSFVMLIDRCRAAFVVCQGLFGKDERCTQRQSGNDRLPHVRTLLRGAPSSGQRS